MKKNEGMECVASNIENRFKHMVKEDLTELECGCDLCTNKMYEAHDSNQTKLEKNTGN